MIVDATFPPPLRLSNAKRVINDSLRGGLKMEGEAAWIPPLDQRRNDIGIEAIGI